MHLPRARIARDRAGMVALILITLALPARAWTLVSMPTAASFAVYPQWAQCLTISVYACQLGAEAWGDQRARFVAGAICASMAAMTAALFWWGDPTNGGVPTWITQSSMQLWVCWSLSKEIGRREAADPCAILEV